MKIIDKYIVKKYLTTYFFCMAIFAVIIMVFDFSERLDDFLKHNAPVDKILFEYFAGQIPFFLNMLSPLINFIAVIFFTSRMADQTEIVPILNGGMSFNRLLYPYTVGASIVFAIMLIFNLFIIPHTNRLLVDFTNVYIDPIENRTKVSTHMQLDSNHYVYLDNFDNAQQIGYNFVLETFEGKELKEKLMADRISWDSLANRWAIEQYTIRKIDGLKEEMIQGARIDTLLDMHPRDFEVYDNVFMAMSMRELNTRIEKEKIRGTGNVTPMLVEKYKRYVYPFSAFILTLMGVALSSKKVRGGIGLSLGIGIGLSFVYMVFMQFTNTFSLQGGLHPFLGVIIPNIIFSILTIILIIKAPK
jgi:lipopolysaccharide export system permease protein